MANQIAVIGPFGGTGGTPWDDGSYTGVKSIELSHGEAIGTFNVVYDSNGEPRAEQHPANIQNFTTARIDLDFPREKIVKVSGYTDQVTRFNSSTPVVRSLTFTTNLGNTFGPFGTQGGTQFSIPIEDGKIVGFKGRSGTVLDKISFNLGAN